MMQRMHLSAYCLVRSPKTRYSSFLLIQTQPFLFMAYWSKQHLTLKQHLSLVYQPHGPTNPVDYQFSTVSASCLGSDRALRILEVVPSALVLDSYKFERARGSVTHKVHSELVGKKKKRFSLSYLIYGFVFLRVALSRSCQVGPGRAVPHKTSAKHKLLLPFLSLLPVSPNQY